MTDKTTGGEVVEVSPSLLAFMSGQRAFRAGEPQPEDVWTDDQWRGPCCPGQCRLLGWRLERAMQIGRQIKIRKWAEDGDDLNGW